MKKIFFFFLSIGICYSLPAQHNKLLVKFCPLALIDDPTFPAIQGGLEWALSKRFGWYNDLGIGYRKSLFENTDTNFVLPHGFALRTEIRYYLERLHGFGKARRDVYLAVNVFYIMMFTIQASAI